MKKEVLEVRGLNKKINRYAKSVLRKLNELDKEQFNISKEIRTAFLSLKNAKFSEEEIIEEISALTNSKYLEKKEDEYKDILGNDKKIIQWIFADFTIQEHNSEEVFILFENANILYWDSDYEELADFVSRMVC